MRGARLRHDPFPNQHVTPAPAGVHPDDSQLRPGLRLDSGLRRNDTGLWQRRHSIEAVNSVARAFPKRRHSGEGRNPVLSATAEIYIVVDPGLRRGDTLPGAAAGFK
jgi:hypothetical protein